MMRQEESPRRPDRDDVATAESLEALRPLVIVPTYNERENIERIVPAIFEAVPFAEILIVDDNSPDGTGALADALAEADPRVHVLHRTGKEGLGKAYVAGFRWAIERGVYDRVHEMDADFSHPPAYLRDTLRASLDADVVVGSRWVPGGATENWGLARQVISRGGSLYARTILGMRVRDMTAGFVCWRTSVLASLPLDALHASGYGFQVELKYRAHQLGFRIVEVPIRFPDRTAGQSKMSRRIVAEAMVTVWKLRLGR